jgi:hypothetical protein
MNVACRIRNKFSEQGLVLQGFMPANDTHEVVDFLYWLMVKETEVYRTSSSDLAAIACCLCHLSFEILTVENFGLLSGRETTCRLIYDIAPLYNEYSSRPLDMRERTCSRELSTTVSLSQPNETFSTFPIIGSTANRCRLAWEEGDRAGAYVTLGPCESDDSGLPQDDLIMTFRNDESLVANQRRINPGPWIIASLLALFSTDEVNQGLAEVLHREDAKSLSRIAEMIRSDTIPSGKASLDDPNLWDTFTVIQAFFMGYYYQIFSRVIDTSTLEVKTVSRYWGYRSPDLLRRLHKSFRGLNGLYSGSDENKFAMTRTDVLSLLATFYANKDSHNSYFPSLRSVL